ncbi:protein fem-1 homolog A-like [Toxorhynchites rutilus septentrionalis]|uniref:protein fem-1 homolog A-like n=1 Tax=Toxorhynchites rutilus septentrionalis TaxID=329112 RepID=UPI00247A1C10|nr:protein fem-1 homolog A-like [Toxorhynchites rutilus septentrionalis]
MSEYTEEYLSNMTTSLCTAIQTSTENLPKELREKLQSFPRNIRKKVAATTKDGFTALAKACVVGNATIVKYLKKVCDVNIEQKSADPLGLDSQTNSYTPLGWACKSGHSEVLKYLIHLGADVDGPSDCGSTPVLIACIQKDDDMVRYLMKKGADLRKPNNNGETCFFTWIKWCLLEFNKSKLKTALLLLDHGADPFASCNGDDALQFVVKKGNHKMVLFLIHHVSYTPERMADAFELLGAAIYMKFANQSLAVRFWRDALDIRMFGDNYIIKLPENPPQAIYGNANEFNTNAELDEIAVDLDAIGIQSLLIYERILGIDDKETVVNMICLGYYYQQTNRNQMCMDLWVRVLQRHVQKYTMSCFKTLYILQRILGFMLDSVHARDTIPPQFEDVWTVFKLLASSVIKNRQLVNTKEQQINVDCMVHYLAYLIDVLLCVAKSGEEREMIKKFVRPLVSKDVRCPKTGQTLLHLSVQPGGHRYDVKGPGFRWVFQAGSVTKLLLECGAHIDSPDSTGTRPSELLVKNPRNNIPVYNFISLKCFCANTIVKNEIPYAGIVSRVMEDFVRKHE